MFTEHMRPRAHVVMDDFFDDAALRTIFREVRALEPRLRPGLAREVGHDGQSVFFEHPRRKNRAVWIHEPSRTLRLFRERLFADAMLEAFANAEEPLFQIVPNCGAPHLQVSSYMTGDHYDFHEDEGAGVNLTTIVFLAEEPARIRGGDLVLAHGGDQVKIRFRHNRLVVFPSKTLHRVTPVRVGSEDPRHARISLQCWLTYGKDAATGRAKRRAPEADRPTFLLAEEPILAAAQLLSSAHEREVGAEEMYWGSFYLTRILTQNLRCLAASHAGLELGPVRIRPGADIEVAARGRLHDAPIRLGFVLRAPPTPAAEALRLFAETGKGASRARRERPVPAGADERETARLLARVLSSRPA